MPHTTTTPRYTNLADVRRVIGDVPEERVRCDVPFGRATEQDLLSLLERKVAVCELIDGILVEKAMGIAESMLAQHLARILGNFVVENDLGALSGEAGPFRFLPGVLRLPDVSFVPWAKLPGKVYPTGPISDAVPDLAVEVLSESNTRREIELKLRHFFLGGVRLAWVIDPKTHTAEVYTAPDRVTRLTAADALDGGDVLPGFTLPLATLFKYAPPPAKPARRKRSP